MHARSQSLSPLVDGCINSVFLQCRLFQTSARRCFSSSTLLIQHSYTFCCITPQTLQSNTGFRSGLFGGQRSGPTKSSVSCCGLYSSLMMSLTRWDRIVERQTYRLQHAWSLASAERVRHGGKAVDFHSIWSTKINSIISIFHSNRNLNGFGERWSCAQQTHMGAVSLQ